MSFTETDNNFGVYYPVAEPDIGDLEVRYVVEALRSGWVSSLGPSVREFEQRFAVYCGVRHGVSTCNGSAALQLTLASLGIKPGDEVIVPTLTFIATASAVAHSGATPTFADVDPHTWCVDPGAIRKAISPRTRAIIVVHLYGHPANMEPILTLADQYDIPVIEDAAEAHGALYRGRRVGGLAKAAIFSFHGNKLITTGEGGMMVTSDTELAERARFLAHHAMDPCRSYWHSELGYNYGISNVQAALGLAQLERIDQLLLRKCQIFKHYRDNLAPLGAGLTLNPTMPWASSSYWMVCVLLPEFVSRAAVVRELMSAGIESRPFFSPLHMLPPFRDRRHESEQLHMPVAEKIASRGINLPSSTLLKDHDVQYIATTLKSILRSQM